VKILPLNLTKNTTIYHSRQELRPEGFLPVPGKNTQKKVIKKIHKINEELEVVRKSY
jgi:hypothetical protein